MKEFLHRTLARAMVSNHFFLNDLVVFVLREYTYSGKKKKRLGGKDISLLPLSAAFVISSCVVVHSHLYSC